MVANQLLWYLWWWLLGGCYGVLKWLLWYPKWMFGDYYVVAMVSGVIASCKRSFVYMNSHEYKCISKTIKKAIKIGDLSVIMMLSVCFVS